MLLKTRFDKIILVETFLQIKTEKDGISMQFNITTFNLRLNTVTDKENAWPYRLNSVLHYINSVTPLIFGTQEVLDDMLIDLNNHLPKYSHIGVTRKQHEEANAIFYNHDILEIKESGTFWLSKTPDIPNSKYFNSACIRICTWGEFMFKNSRNNRFRVFNTHLDHISHRAQIAGIKIIFKKMNLKYTEEKLPTIFIGDLNSTSKDKTIQYLKNEILGNNSLVDAMDLLPQANYGATFHNFTGMTKGHPIDHIFVSTEVKVHKIEIYRKKIFDIYPSDHYPITSLIEI